MEETYHELFSNVADPGERARSRAFAIVAIMGFPSPEGKVPLQQAAECSDYLSKVPEEERAAVMEGVTNLLENADV